MKNKKAYFIDKHKTLEKNKASPTLYLKKPINAKDVFML